MIRAKTLNRCLLVSDAVALAGMKPGIYQFAGKSVELTAERCVRLVGTEYLAGSAIELARGVENSVRFAGISLEEAVSLATLQPMHLLDAKTRVEANPNLILFEWDAGQCEINLIATIVAWRIGISFGDTAMMRIWNWSKNDCGKKGWFVGSLFALCFSVSLAAQQTHQESERYRSRHARNAVRTLR